MENKIIISPSYDLEEVKKAAIIACIKEANEAGGLSQQDIAKQLGVTGSAVSKYVRDYGLDWKKPLTEKEKAKQNTLDTLLATLTKMGYVVTPPAKEVTPDKE